MANIFVVHEVELLPIPCSKCGSGPMVVRLAKNYAVACINYDSNSISGCINHGIFDSDLNQAIINWNNANHEEE